MLRMVRLAAPKVQESVTRKLAAGKYAFSAGAALALILSSALLIGCGSSKVTLPAQIAPNIAAADDCFSNSSTTCSTSTVIALQPNI